MKKIMLLSFVLFFCAAFAQAETLIDKSVISIGGRYNIRGDNEEEPHEAIARIEYPIEQTIKDLAFTLTPYIYYLYDLDEAMPRRIEVGCDVIKAGEVKGFVVYAGGRIKGTHYSYTDTDRGEAALIAGLYKKEPWHMGPIAWYPFFKNEWLNCYYKNEKARNEFEIGLGFPCKEQWEIRFSSTHIDEAYGGPDTDMITCLIRWKK